MTESPAASRPAMHVLYLEDSPVDAEVVCHFLERSAPEIVLDHVTTKAAALEKLAPANPPYDLLLTDQYLPDGAGLEVLTHVRERQLPLAVVLLTGSSDQETAIAALKAGADDYLVKRDDYLARLPRTLTAARERFQAERQRRNSPLRVLYAEHKPFDSDLAQRHFARHAPHIRLEIVADGNAVLARLPADGAPPGYDVLLLDYQLPGANALDIVSILRIERQLDIPVVIVTGQGSEEVVAEAMRLGVDDYLVKHNGYLAELPATLERAHRQNQLRREQEALKLATARLNHVLGASPSIVYALRREGEHLVPTWVSDNITRLFGYSTEECLAPGWWFQHLHEADRERMSTSTARLLAAGQQVDEYRFYDKAGAVHWVRDDLRLVRDAAGHDIEVVGSWNDITLERAAQERLRLHAEALASSHDTVVITDLKPTIIAVNPAFSQVTGYAESEALGQNPNMLTSGRHDRSFFQSMWASVLESGHWQGEIWNRRKNGEIYPQWTTISTVRDDRGQPSHYVAVASDLTQLRHSEEKLLHLSHYDPLTGLPNRVLLDLRLQHALARAQSQTAAGGNCGVAVLVIDQDNFKTINDSLGHAVGDKLLVALAQRLTDCVVGDDTLARTGGNQFVLMLEDLADYQNVELAARQIQAALEAPFVLADGHETYVRASIGISISPEDGTTAQALLHRADLAMHRAKEQGGNRFDYYTDELNARALATLELEAALRRALERGEFVLHYQPQVDLASGAIIGAEALLRWQRPGRGLVPPGEFIAAAEHSGLIGPIGTWVIHEACRQMRAWSDEKLAELAVAVNVSTVQFRSSELEQQISDALTSNRLEPQRLILELTESMLIDNPDEAVRRLTELKRRGVRLSLDDFGTGYSSLGYLSSLPIDQLKIDRSFIVDMVTDPRAAIIATSVIALAHRMGFKVVAEGVETEAQMTYLRTHSCDKIQGFYFSRAVPAEDFAALLRQGTRLSLPRQQEGGQTLLLVDDEPNILSAIRRLLRNEGYRVLTANDAMEGLQLLANNPVQVIISDQRMPGMSGTEFLRRVKTLHPDTVRIILSGYTDLESVTRAVNEGALYKFLTKPWDEDQLREQIRDAFRYYEAVIQPRRRKELSQA